MAATAVSQSCTYTQRIENEVLFLETPGSTLSFPSKSRDFSVTTKNGRIEIHAQSDMQSPMIPYRFYLRATGFQLDGNEGEYIGTISLFNDYFVGHLFTSHSRNFSPFVGKKVIFKYPLNEEDGSKVDLPEGARKICTYVRRGKPYLYAIVNPAQSIEFLF